MTFKAFLFLIVCGIFIFACMRDNPFDSKSRNYNGGTRPSARFLQDSLSAYRFDSITINIECADTSVGGKEGAIRTFYFNWTNSLQFEDSVDGTGYNTFSIVKVFSIAGTYRVRMMAADFDGQTSEPDTLTVRVFPGMPDTVKQDTVPRVVDTIPPVLAIAIPQAFLNIADTAVRVNVSAVDVSGILWVRINGFNAVRTASSWSATVRLRHGYDTLRVSAMDSSVHPNRATDSVVVIQNFPPRFAAGTAPHDTSLIAAAPYSASLSAQDADNDPLLFRILPSSVFHGNPFPPVLTQSGSGATVSYTPVAAGIDTICLEVKDSWNGADTLKWRTLITLPIDTTPANHPPVLVNIGNKTVSEGSMLSFKVEATDPDQDSVRFSMTGAPTGASLNGSTFKWRPNKSQEGAHQVTFIARDTGIPSLSDSVTITITVDD